MPWILKTEFPAPGTSSTMDLSLWEASASSSQRPLRSALKAASALVTPGCGMTPRWQRGAPSLTLSTSLAARLLSSWATPAGKASTEKWWPGFHGGVIPPEKGGWIPVGPTAAPADGKQYAGSPVTALNEDGISKIIDDFRTAASRAVVAGFDAVEIHSAHGYLLHQFYSPLSNTRTDGWGSDYDGRVRLPLAVADAVRGAIPDDMPLLARLSVTDWRDDGWSVEDSIELSRRFALAGVDLVDASSGGNSSAPIPVAPGYQADLAARVRAEADVPTATVGMIWTGELAEDLLNKGCADAVMVGRAALRDTNWPLRAAHELGVPNEEAPWHPARFRGAWR